MPPSAPIDTLTGLEAARLGVYVHFPFCLSKCPYCDFASVVAKKIPAERYAEAILTELETRLRTAPSLEGRTVDSLFFGGGTPSLWAPELVGRVIRELGRRFRISSTAELTLEANPGAADAERFRGYREAGINRLSMGVQSFNTETLRFLGRAHTGDEALRAYEAARTAGFENVSLDFIYGVPGQTVDQARADAERASSLAPTHLSAYALTLDKESLAEEVPLAKQLARGEVMLPPDDDTCAMNASVRELYAAQGLERYEVSNYARPGFHSRHNALYWTGGEYLALGTGATGFVRDATARGVEGTGGTRYSNHRSWEKYLAAAQAGRVPEDSREALTATELFFERLAMGLRLTRGVDVRATCEQFGESYEERAPALERIVEGGLARWDSGRFVLTPRGMDVHSAIAARLM